jgi:hypothetical protein
MRRGEDTPAMEPEKTQPDSVQEEHSDSAQNKLDMVSAAVGVQDGDIIDMDISSRTELDSHANMPVVGRNAYVISRSGEMADVSPFSPDYKSMAIPIVDAAVLYECPLKGEPYILVIRNALHVPSMKGNLMPPFVMREAGVQVNLLRRSSGYHCH